MFELDPMGKPLDVNTRFFERKLEGYRKNSVELKQIIKLIDANLKYLGATGSGKRKRGRPMKGKGLVKDISTNIISPVLKYLYSKLDKSDKAKIQKKSL